MTDRIPTILTFDVEDLVGPESDDAVLWMARALTEHGLTGSFMIVGEKARLWERRGRRDVIEALKAHHLGYHSTWHSVRPTTTEHCLAHDVAGGVDALWAWDRAGWQDTERILGRALLGWARTGYSWAPSIQALMGRMGRAYIYSPAQLPGHEVTWYAGCLGFHDGDVGVDSAFQDDAEFTATLAAADQRLHQRAAASERARYFNFFIGHPTRIVSTAFWDGVNFMHGANPPREAWQAAPMVDAPTMARVKANFRRLCEWLRARRDIEIVGWGELIRRFDGQRADAAHAEVVADARAIASARAVRFSERFTAAELLLLMCRALTDPAQRYTRPTALGPLATPPAGDGRLVGAAAWRAAARAIADDVARTGYLPSTVEVDGKPAGVASAFVALAEIVAGADRAAVAAIAPFPAEAEAIAARVAEGIPQWPIHPRGMDLTRLLEQTRLQCWALKPALPRELLR